MAETRAVTLQVWRQAGPGAPGGFQEYRLADIPEDMRFLDLLDVLNAQIAEAKGDKIAYDYACRDGRCGQCALTVNGIPHGSAPGKTICKTPLVELGPDEVIRVEPFYNHAFGMVRDLCTDRTVLDRIVEGGGFRAIKTTGGLMSHDSGCVYPKNVNEPCISCGACVAACRNGSAALFTAAAFARMNRLEADESKTRATRLVQAMDAAGFGACSNFGSCEAVCPTGITTDVISALNRAYLSESVARFLGRGPKAPVEAAST